MNSFYNKSEKKNSLFAQTISSDLIISENPIEIYSAFEPAKKNNLYGHFRIRASEDRSKTLVYYESYLQEVPEAKKKGNSSKEALIQLGVLSNGSNLDWTAQWKIPLDPKTVDFIDYHIDNNGNAFVLCKTYFEKRKNEIGGKPNYSYTIYGFFDKGKNVKEFIIPNDLVYINSLRLAFNGDQDLVCAGFFSNKKGKFFNPALSGTVFMKINLNERKIEKYIKNDFSKGQLESLLGEKIAKQYLEKNGKVHIDYVSNLGLQFDDENTLYLFAERITPVLKSNGDSYKNLSNIYLFAISDSGQPKFHSIIRRLIKDESYSFDIRSLKKDGRPAILMFNNPKYKVSENRDEAHYSNYINDDLTLYLIQIEKSGQLEYKTIADFRNNINRNYGYKIPQCDKTEQFPGNESVIGIKTNTSGAMWILRFK